jgi:very-short-patch-repair endonuclease
MVRMSDWNDRLRQQFFCHGAGNAADVADHGELAYLVTCGLRQKNFERTFWLMSNMLDRCESPIERALISAIVVFWSGHCRIRLRTWDRKGSWGFVDLEDGEISLSPWRGRDPRSPIPAVTLWTQMPLGKYRADIFASARKAYLCDDGKILWARKTMVVECDGHDFHERTKEQASRDRERDRALQRRGHLIHRFTGSDIWASASKCAGESLKALTAALDVEHAKIRDAEIRRYAGMRGGANA